MRDMKCCGNGTLAIIAFIQPFVAWSGSSDAVKDLRMRIPALFWAIVCVIGIIRYGRRGHWLLLGTPLTLTISI